MISEYPSVVQVSCYFSPIV